MPFRVFSNANFQFNFEKFTWRSFTAAKVLPTTSRVKLIDKREFAKAAQDENSEIFIVHIAALKVPIVMLIHPLKTSQVQGSDKSTLATL